METICSICNENFRDPYSTPCGHLFCRECLTVESSISCPSCDRSLSADELVPVPLSVRNILQRPRVTCSNCGQSSIPQENLADHTRQGCPKTLVHCPAASVKCPWIGPRDQLPNHSVSCSFYSVQRLVTQLKSDNQQLVVKLSELEEHGELQYRSRTQEIQDLRDNQSIDGTEFLEQLFIEESKIVETTAQLNDQRERISQLQVEMAFLQSELQSSQAERERLQQVALEHEHQIEQLSRKQQIMAGLIGYHNADLIDRLAQCEQRLMKLSERQLTDRDLFIVVQHALINKPCELLDLQSNQITEQGISILVDALQNNSTLQTLLLHNNRLSDAGVHHLARFLATNKSSLTTLELESNGITDQGATELAEMLRTNSTLLTLYLSDNRIGDRGVQVLSDALTQQNTTLKELVLDKNAHLSDLTAQALIRMLEQNQSLKTLRLWDCQLSEEAKANLQQIANAKTDFTLIC